MPRVYNKSKKAELTPPQKWFTPKEAAEITGKSKRTLRRRVLDGIIEAHVVCGTTKGVLYNPHDIYKMMQGYEQKF